MNNYRIKVVDDPALFDIRGQIHGRASGWQFALSPGQVNLKPFQPVQQVLPALSGGQLTRTQQVNVVFSVGPYPLMRRQFGRHENETRSVQQGSPDLKS